MVDPIVSKTAQHAVDHAAQQGPQPPRHVTPEEQSQFEDALHRPQEGAGSHAHHSPHDAQQHVHHVEHHEGVQGVQPGHESYGDALVQKVNEAQKAYHAQAEKFESAMNHGAADGDLSPQDLMKAQYEMMKLSLQTEFVTKGADKTSTDVQTLMNRSN